MSSLKDNLLLNNFIVLGLGLISGYSLNLVYSLIKTKRVDVTEERNGDKPVVRKGVCGLIGNTSLVKVNSLSELTGCEILAKAELTNPGGSAKDRVALNIIEEAESNGLIVPHQGYTIYEGTVGSTGISLATICLAKGYNCVIVMPDDQSQEKYMALERLQARIEKVRPASIIDPRQFVNRAKLLANEDPKGYFSDQFENLANYRAHLKHTGPEIWEQTGGNIDAFVMGAGTGGTLAGITQYIKERKPDLKVLLVDPTGSGLYYKVKANTFFSPLEKEGSRKRHQVDTIVEGVGINRLTQNFSKALPNVDDAVTVTDREAVLMARFILKKDGLFIGSSTALNLVGSYKLAKRLGPGKTIVTLLCDSGLRHHTKFWNDEYLQNLGLPTDYPDDLSFLD